jgi:hypothetical protein
MTTDDETAAAIEREVDAKLEEELRVRRARLREEVAARLRREAAAAHHARINRRHPIEGRLAGLTQAEENERQRQMAERTAATCAKMDKANARRVDGQVTRGLQPKRADAAGGGSAFRIKG